MMSMMRFVCRYCLLTLLDDLIYNKDFILDIDGIQSHGVGAADITKLKANGYFTVTVGSRAT